MEQATEGRKMVPPPKLTTGSMDSVADERNVPRRPFGSAFDNDRLPETVSIVGLGCSSFSTFFWSAEDEASQDESSWTPETLDRNHPRVQEWIDVVKVALIEYGITLMDTAPWYGHGTSEVVIGWALDEVNTQGIARDSLTINTKVGRYLADPRKQFDFSYKTTVKSVQRSLERMKCGYIDVLQLHDPEFARSVDELLEETIPAMMECQRRKWCRALGMTGYPLHVQHELLVRGLEQGVVWDQSLVYSHFNLHDTSLFSEPQFNKDSFAGFCKENSIALLTAAPLSMGLLAHYAPPPWHPASEELKEACSDAASICESNGVDISTLALLFAMSDTRIPCTIIGMKDTNEVRAAAAAANRFSDVGEKAPGNILNTVLSRQEMNVFGLLQDRCKGPFARVWESNQHKWDGVQEAKEFWKQLDGDKEIAGKQA